MTNYKRTLLEEYYEGFLKQIQAEVNHMTKIIKHNAQKGISNERILIDILKKFLPKKYSLGTGIIIDHKGNPSGQCDIVIYDSYYNPDLLSQRVIGMFPIEAVYGTIEVKTTMRQKDVKEATLNIKSVKDLSFISTKIPVWEISNPDRNTIRPGIYHTFRPFGLIFSYDTTMKKYETIRKNFLKILNKIPEESYFDCAFILTKSIMFWKEHPKGNNKPKNQMVYDIFGMKNNGGISPETARGFLNFLIYIYDLLNSKRIAPINIRDDYLPTEFSRTLRLSEL